MINPVLFFNFAEKIICLEGFLNVTDTLLKKKLQTSFNLKKSLVFCVNFRAILHDTTLLLFLVTKPIFNINQEARNSFYHCPWMRRRPMHLTRANFN